MFNWLLYPHFTNTVRLEPDGISIGGRLPHQQGGWAAKTGHPMGAPGPETVTRHQAPRARVPALRGLGLRSGFDHRPGRPHQQGPCEARLGCQDATQGDLRT